MLDRVQRLLQEVYRLDVSLDVQDFYVGQSQFKELTERGIATTSAKEQLLVLEESGETSLALFIEDGVLERLRRNDPLQRLTESNRADFCLLAEGVSHFLYLCWKAARGQTVTQLELELQAEVDKYVACFLAMWAQDPTCFPHKLKEALFRRVHFREDLDAEEASRYHTANRLALTYCAHLERSFLKEGELRGAMDELRHFYRLDQPAKLGHIASRQLA